MRNDNITSNQKNGYFTWEGRNIKSKHAMKVDSMVHLKMEKNEQISNLYIFSCPAVTLYLALAMKWWQNQTW